MCITKFESKLRICLIPTKYLENEKNVKQNDFLVSII